MLLIGDIHITTHFKDKIISGIKNFVDQNPDEKNIIFLGDYVYHFSYDRTAILDLYNLFIELFEKGKNVYILAGNHDRLGTSFVYQEASKAFNIINKLSGKFGGKLLFITEPVIETIDEQECLFFPFVLNFEKIKYTDPLFISLSESENKNEQLSGYINQRLEDLTKSDKKIIVFHHYYINNTVFPGQKSKFSYKNIALSEKFLKNEKIRLISGHLHQAFTKDNYLCIGSVRSTNSLEINQNKFLFKYKGQTDELTALSFDINPYVSISHDDKIDEKTLKTEISEISDTNKGWLKQSPIRNIKFEEYKSGDIKDLSLIIKVANINYANIDDYIDPALITQIKDIKLKKNLQSVGDLIESFSISTDSIKTGFSDRKTILNEYIKKKFGEDYKLYQKILEELKLS